MFNEEDDEWMMDGAYTNYEETYQCLPATELLLKSLRDAVEFGGKMVMPASALETLYRMNVSYPLMFAVDNEASTSGHVTHCGVLEFSAPEGTVYLPPWVMKTIGVRSGDFVTLRNVTLRLGSFVKLQPQSVDFLEITDPKAVLEHAFRSFSALTRGDIIQIGYNESVYELAILEVQPENARHAISIVETDLQVDFAAPVGYVEPEPIPRQEKSIAGSLGSLNQSQTGLAGSVPDSIGGFKPFSGPGNRLRESSTAATPSAPVPTPTTSAAGPAPLKLPPGMLFFGSSPSNTKPDPKKDGNPAPGFKAFGGSANKLR